MQSMGHHPPLRRGRDSGFFLRADHEVVAGVELPVTAGELAAPSSVAVDVAAVAAVAGETVAVEARSDEALVAGMIDNAPWAWREFQRRYDRLIHRCITKVTRRFTTLVGPDDVRDIYASLYLSLVANGRHKLRTFDPARGNRFSSWIGLLAINCAYDYLRGLKREPNKGSLAEAADLVCELPDPYEQAVESERAEIAARLLDGFSEKDRTFAALYFGEELDPNEIAVRMNISVKTVYSKKHKIQSRLEAFLGQTNESAPVQIIQENVASTPAPVPTASDEAPIPATIRSPVAA
jgi:RNA polymerase sigma-70 factor (ECF subfamily)